MKEHEIEEFIEEMEQIGDKWTREETKRVYGQMSLEKALAHRKAQMSSYFNIIGKVINRR